MNLLKKIFGGGGTATVARDRLKIVLSHERGSEESDANLIAQLQKDIIAVICKRIDIDPDKVNIKMDRENGSATLGIDIELSKSAVESARVKSTTKIESSESEHSIQSEKQQAV